MAVHRCTSFSFSIYLHTSQPPARAYPLEKEILFSCGYQYAALHPTDTTTPTCFGFEMHVKREAINHRRLSALNIGSMADVTRHQPRAVGRSRDAFGRASMAGVIVATRRQCKRTLIRANLP
ncbi:hypothetical protein FRB95_000091 [Tulasnella sp. JGI-2019a]|nr:hypothetical protein FRB95_000091 [Tulasnella sp. JGI-2019a]